ncbi:hypothetical protein [Pseudonocardia zijingensis]|uniref:Uncharacterized protein n=1 Tax=Pseudonocardia zijingensis TaxID=153376 RepID=A0ABN1N8S8_9PSEU
MARSHVRLQFGMWRKEGHDDTSKDARWLYVTILSDETLNQAGMVRLSIDLWADDAGMTSEEAREALRELVERRFVVVDRHELLVRTFIRNDGVADQPNVLRNALELARQIRSPTIRRALAAELRKLPLAPPPREIAGKGGSKRMFVYPDPHAVADEIDPALPPPPSGLPIEGSTDVSSNPSLNPSNNPSETLPFGTLPTTLPGTPWGRGRGRGESYVGSNSPKEFSSSEIADAIPDGDPAPAPAVTKKRPTRAEQPPREDVEQLCSHLADRVEANTGKRPTITQRWRDSARLLLDKDLAREPDALGLATRLADWATNDEFWRTNVLSMPTFREKFTQLRLKARREWEQTHAHRPSRRTTDDKRAAVPGLVAQVLGTDGATALRPDLRAITGGNA